MNMKDIDNHQIELALEIALKAHKGQIDLDGNAVILHPIAVGLKGNNSLEQCVGFLHDVVEDTTNTFDDLLSLGVAPEIIKVLRILTHDKSIPYMDYIRNIKESGNVTALQVKLNDLRHNLQRGKAGGHTKQVKKHTEALEYLLSSPDNIYDVTKIKAYIDKCQWRWAKTYQSIPHEYIVRNKCELSDDEFLYIVKAQRDTGIHEVWGKYYFPYLYIDGYKYWTMGDPIDQTIILNRQKVFSEFDKLKNTPHHYEEESKKEIAKMLTSTFSKPIFEVGFGDGWLIKEAQLSPDQWYGVEPSRKCIEYVKEKYPTFAKRIMHQSFEEAINKWKNQDCVVTALFGTASYLMNEYLRLLNESGRDYFLMFYKDGYCPAPFKNMHHFSYTKDQLEHLFNANIVEYGNYYIVSSENINHGK